MKQSIYLFLVLFATGASGYGIIEGPNRKEIEVTPYGAEIRERGRATRQVYDMPWGLEVHEGGKPVQQYYIDPIQRDWGRDPIDPRVYPFVD